VPGHLELALRKVGVGPQNRRDLPQYFQAGSLQAIAPGIEQDVPWELYQHAVVTHLYLETQLRELFELVSQQFEALPHLLELFSPQAILCVGLLLLL
jgi:hypothetical protein